jgi:hypothetical protein
VEGRQLWEAASFFHGFAFILSSDVGWPPTVIAPVMLSLKAWFKVSFSFPICYPLSACIEASVNSLSLAGTAARSRFRSLSTPDNLFRFFVCMNCQWKDLGGLEVSAHLLGYW